MEYISSRLFSLGRQLIHHETSLTEQQEAEEQQNSAYLTAIEGLGALVQTAGEAIVDQSVLQDNLKSGDDVHRASLDDGGLGLNSHFHISFS
jgi:hypothetical protein